MYLAYMFAYCTLIYVKFCHFLTTVFTYFNLEFYSKFALFYTNYAVYLRLSLLLHGANLLIFDCPYIHWMNSCIWIFWNTIKVEVYYG
jgi:hypothetical protein